MTLPTFFPKNIFSWMVAIILLFAFLIRIVGISSVPPSPYWEEVAIGYDAYSILKTGRDHHGNPFPLLAFESFGDFKPSLYFYTVVPFIWLFGLNTLAVRLPSIISGTLLVWVTGKLARELSSSIFAKDSEKSSKQLQICAMLVTAISPWSLIFSRGGWESNLATVLITTSIWLGYKSWKNSEKIGIKLKFTNKSFRYFLLATIGFCLSLYSYHSARIVAPLFGLVFIAPYLFYLKINLKQVTIIFLIGLTFLMPFIIGLKSPALSQRFKETSIFSDISIIQKSNTRIQEDGNTVIARLIHHRYLLFAGKIASNMFSHFDFKYLFLTGDSNPRHSVQYFGMLFHFSVFPLLVGIVVVLKQARKSIIFLFGLWLVISLFPASITTAVPHALRSLSVAPLFFIGIAVGYLKLFHIFMRSNRIIFYLFIVFSAVEFMVFFFHYFVVYPKQYASEWQYGYREMYAQIHTEQNPDEEIFITREYGRPAMYYWFFNQINPVEVQEEDKTALKDQSEFLTFQKYHFVDAITSQDKGLFASSPKKFAEVGGEKISEIIDINGKQIWIIYRK